MNEILNGDCLELMDYISDGSIDMILCDLPYGTTQNKWDSIIPFDKLWNQYERIIKPNGAIVLTAAQPFTSALVMSNPKLFKYDWVWRKPKGTGHLNAKKMPMRDKEDILVFYKKQCLYNPQFSKGTPYKRLNGSRNSLNKGCYGKINGSHNTINVDGKRYPKQVLEFDSDSQNGTSSLHPTQKPVALFEYLIKTYTNAGDLVLDNCAGSGTTAIACINTNRDYIVIEQDEKYFELMKARITKHAELF